MKLFTNRRLILVCLTASTFLLSFMQPAIALESFAGKYDLVKPPQSTTTPEKVEVVELFWYNCPHCKSIEVYLKPWLKTKPDYVEFKYMPAVFKQSRNSEQAIAYYQRQVLFAKAYYTAEVLGIVEEIHSPIFEAVQSGKPPMNSEKAFQQLFAKHGVSEKDFTAKFNRDFNVDRGLRTSETMTANYGITGVPVIIVNGKYRLTAAKADGYDNMVKIINYLVEEERKLMKLPKKLPIVK